jgi:hypothetical protein
MNDRLGPSPAGSRRPKACCGGARERRRNKEERRLDQELDETSPASDPPSAVQPGLHAKSRD